MTDLSRGLDALVPEQDARGDWEQVVADAQRTPRTVFAFAVPIGAAVAVGVALALAWPFGGPTPTMLERALAAIGDGPVVHIVYRGEWGPTRVDLSTGEVTRVLAESELWYDPQRGMKNIWRLEGKVVDERLVSKRELSAREKEQVLALADDYRTALRSKEARVIGPGRISGRAVLWIRVRSEWLPDVADGRNHLLAEEVAVDRDTYEPVYLRSTRDGRPLVGAGAAVVKLERLEAGAGDFDPGTEDPQAISMGGTKFGKRLRPERFDDAVGGAAFWLGPSFGGKPLADASELIVRRRTSRGEPWKTKRGLSIFYGNLRRRDNVPLRALSTPRVTLEEFRGEVSDFWLGASYASAAQEGSVVMARVPSGLVRRDGTFVRIEASNVREVVEAAAALRRVGDPPAAAPALDLARIARAVEARQAHQLRVTGGRPVRPRPIVRRGARPIQRATGAGVSVEVFRNGAVTFDLTRLRRDRRRLVKDKVTVGCVKAADAFGSIGGVLVPFRPRTTVVLPGRLRRGRASQPLKGRLDACEVGLGVGRNWFRRTKGHGLVEIPLTAAGRLFFDRRAAERRADAP